MSFYLFPIWEDRYKEALEKLEEKALHLGLTQHERQKKINVLKFWINLDDNPQLTPLIGKLDEVNYNPDIELRPLKELQDGYQSPQMDDEDYIREITTEERGELKIGVVMNHLATRSRIRALDFDGDSDDDEINDEDKKFIDDFEVDDYHFTQAQMIVVMISLVSELHLLVCPDAPIL
ncbi:hypothetical protein R1flu_003910 [Riccia fluitans]|uniref:Uncharacterized protein n=1 Tax=Riccia fluitans TaxID=41844 RepID=A0ABD1YAZ6_9MARC